MLRVRTHVVDSVTAGRGGFEEGALTLDLEQLRSIVLDDPRIADVHLDLVRPGEAARVVNVLDIFDARKRLEGPTYPGIDGAPVATGHGELHRFGNFQIVETGMPPTGEGGLMVARRAFIDFWGKGAAWSPFSAAHTLVMDLEFHPSLTDKVAVDDSARRSLVAASTAIGSMALDAADEGQVDEFRGTWERRGGEGLPRVAYVYQVQSQGALVDTFLYGSAVARLYPTLIDPVEILDGALVSGNHQRVTTPTIMHCNNPVLLRLLAEDGERVNLLPAILMEGHHKTTPAKQRSAAHAVQLLRYLRADGAVFTQEGGGMSIVDQMLTIEGARKVGIECVALTYEMAGTEGTDRPLIFYTRAAKNLVSTGNRDELVHLEAPERVIGRSSTGSPGGTSGRSTEASEGADVTGALNVPLWVLYGAVSQVGGARARAHSA
jgi:glycine reductase complex component B subunit alpha and beta